MCGYFFQKHKFKLLLLLHYEYNCGAYDLTDTVLTFNVIGYFYCNIGVVHWFTDLSAKAVLASGILITVSGVTTFALLARGSGRPRGTVKIAPHSVS